MKPGLVPHSRRAPGLVLGEHVDLPDDLLLGAHVVIYPGTRIGRGVVVEDHAVVGKPPRLGQFSTAPREVPTSTVLHDGAAVLAGAIVFAGAELGEAVTLGDQASVRERAVVGAKTTIGRGSAVDNDVRIGERVRIQTNCYITAYTIVEDDVFLAPGVVTTNDNTMARHAPDESITGPDAPSRLPHRRRRRPLPGRGSGRGGVHRRGRRRHDRCAGSCRGNGRPRP